ncbi:hypothetical protein PIB30_024818 [Stylosanthes scabra]|uniref:Uncharacterized protein n=1 Tax=Stylosanthes scabra TaxID=79078 RepID=A0ABU6X9K4_9FABA|nr:hypothetical protein [Stylosanthes scabra]
MNKDDDPQQPNNIIVIDDDDYGGGGGGDGGIPPLSPSTFNIPQVGEGGGLLPTFFSPLADTFGQYNITSPQYENEINPPYQYLGWENMDNLFNTIPMFHHPVLLLLLHLLCHLLSIYDRRNEKLGLSFWSEVILREGMVAHGLGGKIALTALISPNQQRKKEVSCHSDQTGAAALNKDNSGISGGGLVPPFFSPLPSIADTFGQYNITSPQYHNEPNPPYQYLGWDNMDNLFNIIPMFLQPLPPPPPPPPPPPSLPSSNCVRDIFSSSEPNDEIFHHHQDSSNTNNLPPLVISVPSALNNDPEPDLESEFDLKSNSRSEPNFESKPELFEPNVGHRDHAPMEN